MRTDTGWHAKHDHIGNAVNLDGTLPANDNWKPQSKRENTSKVPFYLGGADEHHGDRDGRMGKMKKLQSAIYSVPEEQVQRQARDREDLARYAEVQRQERQEQKLQERQRKLEEDSRLQWLLDGRAKAEKSDKDYFLDTRVPRSDRVKESYSHAVAQKEQRQHGLFAGLGETHKATNWETRGRLRTNLPHAPNPIAATENVKVGEALPESQEHFSRQGQGRNRVDPISWRNLPSIPDGDYRRRSYMMTSGADVTTLNNPGTHGQHSRRQPQSGETEAGYFHFGRPGGGAPRVNPITQQVDSHYYTKPVLKGGVFGGTLK